MQARQEVKLQRQEDQPAAAFGRNPAFGRGFAKWTNPTFGGATPGAADSNPTASPHLTPEEQRQRDMLIQRQTDVQPPQSGGAGERKERDRNQQRRRNKGAKKRPLIRFIGGTPNFSQPSERRVDVQKKVTTNPATPRSSWNVPGWECPSCSFYSSIKHSNCSRCGVERPAAHKLPSQGVHQQGRQPESSTPAPGNVEAAQTTRTPENSTQSSIEDRVNQFNKTLGNNNGELLGFRKPHPASQETVPPPEIEPKAQELVSEELQAEAKGPQPPDEDRVDARTTEPPIEDPFEQPQPQFDIFSARRRSSRVSEAVEETGEAPVRLSKKEKKELRRRKRFDEEFEEEQRHQKKDKERQRQAEVKAAEPTPIYLPEFISVGNLANALGVRSADFMAKLGEFGFDDVTDFSHIVDSETAGLIASEFNFTPMREERGEKDLVPAPAPTAEEAVTLPGRPPVITIMGHVDHGKTTLLDWLRKSSVVSTEHGGITQHIGAFSVTMPSGKAITFLDTPGHAAFLSMRRRGANVTDIVILVVAADDSVKPQTIEAIKHAREAEVPIIVAVNKVDKPDVDVERVQLDLARHGVNVEAIGGDVPCVPVSGKTGAGMYELEEAALTLSELLDHRAPTSGPVEGWLLEATTRRRGGGKVATLLVTRGTLRPGAIIVAGNAWARVRTLRNEAGVTIPSVGPGMPVEVDGWRDPPAAGERVLDAGSERRAKEVVELRHERAEVDRMATDMQAINEARRARMSARAEAEDGSGVDSAASSTDGPIPIPFVVKADVAGSVEAVANALAAIGNDEVYARVLQSGVGAVGQSDVEYASAAGASIVSFNLPSVASDAAVARLASQRGVRVMDHNVIYEALDAVRATLSAHLRPRIVQRVVGEAEIGAAFEITVKQSGEGAGKSRITIAGCKVRNGTISRNASVRVLRESTASAGKGGGGEKQKETVYEGAVASLRHIKKDVTEMRKGSECGIMFTDGWSAFKVGDAVQCYEENEERREL